MSVAFVLLYFLNPWILVYWVVPLSSTHCRKEEKTKRFIVYDQYVLDCMVYHFPYQHVSYLTLILALKLPLTIVRYFKVKLYFVSVSNGPKQFIHVWSESKESFWYDLLFRLHNKTLVTDWSKHYLKLVQYFMTPTNYVVWKTN